MALIALAGHNLRQLINDTLHKRDSQRHLGQRPRVEGPHSVCSDRKINWSFWCVRERTREARAGRRGGRRRRPARGGCCAQSTCARAPKRRRSPRARTPAPAPAPRPAPPGVETPPTVCESPVARRGRAAARPPLRCRPRLRASCWRSAAPARPVLYFCRAGCDVTILV